MSNGVLPGYNADDARGKDILGITNEVNALASLVAAWSVEPPLAIGLFGEWGSGKTFFMRKMMDRVALLSRKARESKKRQCELGYYKNIIQIEFNAWHYAEGNLWASLVEHIFANLRVTEDEGPEAIQARRKKLLQQMQLEEEVKARAAKQKEELRLQCESAQKRAVDAKTKRKETSKELDATSLKDVWTPLNVSQAMRNTVHAELQRLGLPGATAQTAAQLRDALATATSLWGRLLVQWELIRKDAAQGQLALFLVFGVAVSIGVPLVLSWAVTKWLQTDASNILGGLLTLTGGFACSAVTWVKTYSARVSTQLDVLERLQRRPEEERARRVAELQRQVDLLAQQEVQAEQEQVGAQARIDKLKEELTGRDSDRMLTEFLQDRAAADDYRKQLGILALIRRDFERLSQLFKKQRTAEEAGTEPLEDATRINRIVLYIDDLDRCPPERVVQVLQAIHLLLAFPLFVVVVGVDARWVSQAVRQRFRRLLRNDPDARGPDRRGEAPDTHPADVSGFDDVATPHDYLEKIFQIPFWLHPMEDKACERLVEELTSKRPASPPPPKPDIGNHAVVQTDRVGEAARQPKTVEAAPEHQTTAQPDVRTPPLPVDGSSGQSANTPDAEAAVKPPDRPPPRDTPREDEQEPEVDLNPRNLDLVPDELELMRKLVPVLGRSPRAVKRFVNCYRLLKAGLTADELSTFLKEVDAGGQYEAVLLLLAIVTGTPQIGPRFFDRLSGATPDFKGMDFGTSRTTDDKSLSAFLTRMGEPHEPAARSEWQRLASFVGEHLDGQDGRLLECLREVAGRVARYSFRTGAPRDNLAHGATTSEQRTH